MNNQLHLCSMINPIRDSVAKINRFNPDNVSKFLLLFFLLLKLFEVTAGSILIYCSNILSYILS
jgi:hypothetical protein